MNRAILTKVLTRAEDFVAKGCRSLLRDQPAEKYLLSPSPVSTALAAMALLAGPPSFRPRSKAALRYLEQHPGSGGGWSRIPGGPADSRATAICETAIASYRQGLTSAAIHLAAGHIGATWLQDVPEMVLGWPPGSPRFKLLKFLILGETASFLLTELSFDHLPLLLPHLPPAARPLIIALASIREMGRKKVSPALYTTLENLVSYQSPNGTWCEDILITSLCVLCLHLAGFFPAALVRGVKWLATVQYPSGAWPGFNRITNWDLGLAAYVLGEGGGKSKTIKKCRRALAKGANQDGSYGTLSPYAFPDLDDTAAALLGLATAGEGSGKYRRQKQQTRELLLRLQNRDGSWGTFPEVVGLPPACTCRPPVHTKSVDVTVHVLMALLRSGSGLNSPEIQKGFRWLANKQNRDGSWNSTWYAGNTFATAQVLELLAERGLLPGGRRKARHWLLRAQQSTGSWPGGSAGECALALTALLKNGEPPCSQPIQRGLAYLASQQEQNGSFQPAYRGVYFSGLYYEDPLAESLAAIRAIRTYLALARPTS